MSRFDRNTRTSFGRVRPGKRSAGKPTPALARRLLMEPLEPRTMLNGLPLVITEFMYHAADATPAEVAAGYAGNDDDDFDFIELHNTSGAVLPLTGFKLTAGVTYEFTEGSLGPDQYVVLVEDVDAFEIRYGTDINVASRYTGKLKNSGEQVILEGPGGALLDFVFLDTWYPTTDGPGYSLVINDPEADPATWGLSQSWHPSLRIGGSPGANDLGLVTGDLVINEILTHTDGWRGDWIELLNTTDDDVNIGGWYLSDNTNTPKKYRIAAGTVIEAGQFEAFNSSENFGPTAPDPGALIPFGLSELGEEVVLSSAVDGALTGYRVSLSFAAADQDVTFGRHRTSTGEVHFPSLEFPTFNAANRPPLVGPLVINEIMFHPSAGGDEFIELYNPNGFSVPLYDVLQPANTWQFVNQSGSTDWVEYVFPAGVNIGAGGYALVVPIEPAVFRATYGVPAAVSIFGPYTNAMDNSGETLMLSRPGTPELDGSVPYYVVERVDFGDRAPWFAEADGRGPALIRTEPAGYGNDPVHWGASNPGGTPGAANQLLVPARIAGRLAFYNNSAFDGHTAGAGVEDDAAIPDGKRPLLPNEAAGLLNYTSFSRGINGVMVDVENLLNLADLNLDNVDDYFSFAVGNDDNPSGWIDAPPPTEVALRENDGNEFSDRVTLIWPDGAIRDQWLQVTVLAGPDTGLSADDVFYVGNAVGETGDSPADARVTDEDVSRVRNNPHGFFNPATIDTLYDFNRDRHVGLLDVLLARANRTDAQTALQLIDLREPAGEVLPGVAEPQSGEAVWSQPLDELAWFYELEQFAARSRASQRHNSPERTVDAVLSTWP